MDKIIPNLLKFIQYLLCWCALILAFYIFKNYGFYIIVISGASFIIYEIKKNWNKN
jgi:hypothetical protein